jgi:hypothetical protein
MTLRLRRKHRPRVDRFAIQQNRVRARKTLLIAKLHAVKAQSAQSAKQGGGRGRVDACSIPLILSVMFIITPFLKSIGFCLF